MRVLVLATGLLAVAAATAHAKPHAKPHGKARARATATSKVAVAEKAPKRASAGRRAPRSGAKQAKAAHGSRRGLRVAHAARRARRFVMPLGPIDGQSLGAPWAGRLHDPAELREGPGYVIRRPWRAFGTTAMVETVERIVSDVADRFYDTHPIAIGDLSAERGGWISDHSSHQSGRDVDIGLIFHEQPVGYPERFVVGTADNLDLEATFVLVEEFARTHAEPDGVSVIFLDFRVQGLLYRWALENGESPEYLATLFQYPHGRGQNAGLVRHEPNHADHLHVRFRCPPSDTICR